MTPKRKFVSSFLLIGLSVGVSVALAAMLLNWKYASTFHSVLSKGKWPVNSYRYNSVTQNYEMTPLFSKPLLDNSYYLKTHSLGFRIPRLASSDSIRQGGLLAIGCSFTFGDGVEAEETFTYLAARALGLDSYNYGVCSYSYASSIIQLEDLDRQGVLEQLKPSVILLGTGFWLVQRSLSPYYPSPDIQLTYPYISKRRSGMAEITYPPQFVSVRHAVGFATTNSYFDGERRDVPLTLRRRLLLLDTIPRVLVAKLQLKSFRNEMTPYELYSFVVDRISRVTRKIGARLVILNLPRALEQGKVSRPLRKAVEECDCATLVDGMQALKTHGARKAQLSHPDKEAHAAYARGIVTSLTGNQTDSRLQ